LPEPDSTRDELRARLWRLPRQLLLALINGTAILVIVAAIVALVALSKVTHLANDVASAMTDAVLSRSMPNRNKSSPTSRAWPPMSIR
jgi:hypothetical protein